MSFFYGGNDTSGDGVALHNAAENIHENTLHIFVAENDAECGGDLFFGRAAADIEKIRGAAAIMLNDIHGSHGQAGAVDETGDVAIELDVIEVELAGLDLQRRFFTKVAHLLNIFVAI